MDEPDYGMEYLGLTSETSHVVSKGDKRDWRERLSWGGVRCLLGGFLICLSFGSDFSYPNINTYLTSYMRQNGYNEGLRYTDFVFLTTSKMLLQGFAMPFIGGLARRLGTRPSLLIGSTLYSGGYMLTYFTVQSYFPLAIITLALHGLAFCFVYATTIGSAQTWFPASRRGLVASIVVSGYGFGSSLWTPIQTYTVNPDNLLATCSVLMTNLTASAQNITAGLTTALHNVTILQPVPTTMSSITTLSGDSSTNQTLPVVGICGNIVEEKRRCDRYFTEPGVLDKVPNMFLILGIIYAVIGFLAVLLVSDNKEEEDNDGLLNDAEDKNKLYPHLNTTEHSEKEATLEEKNVDEAKEKITDSENVKTPSLSPLQVLKTMRFYQLWFGFLSISLTIAIMGNYSKVFGMKFINDDHYFANVAIVQNILNGLSRVGWGYNYDRFGFKRCFTIICVVVSFTVTTLPLLPQICNPTLAKVIWGLYMCVLYSTCPGIYAIIAAEVSRAFGPKHYQANFGLLYTQYLAYSVIIIIMSKVLFNFLGFTGMFLVAGVFGGMGLLAVHLDSTINRFKGK